MFVYMFACQEKRMRTKTYTQIFTEQAVVYYILYCPLIKTGGGEGAGGFCLTDKIC